MKSIIIHPKDEAELNFFLELANRLDVKITTSEELQDDQLLKFMEENRNTGKTDRKAIMDSLHNILNEDQPSYKNED